MKPTFALFVFASILALSQAQAQIYANCKGPQWGVMKFANNSSGLIATYQGGSGKIYGTAGNARISGYWVEPSSGQKCASKKQGSFYWGRYHGSVSRGGIKGKWGYCTEPASMTWNCKFTNPNH